MWVYGFQQKYSGLLSCSQKAHDSSPAAANDPDMGNWSTYFVHETVTLMMVPSPVMWQHHCFSSCLLKPHQFIFLSRRGWWDADQMQWWRGSGPGLCQDVVQIRQGAIELDRQTAQLWWDVFSDAVTFTGHQAHAQLFLHTFVQGENRWLVSALPAFAACLCGFLGASGPLCKTRCWTRGNFGLMQQESSSVLTFLKAHLFVPQELPGPTIHFFSWKVKPFV